MTLPFTPKYPCQGKTPKNNPGDPQVSFPVKLPRFTDDEFKAKKEAYTAEYGHYVTMFKLEDIIHIRVFDEPDDAEFADWKKAARCNYLINTYPESRKVSEWRKEKDEYMAPKRFEDILEHVEKKRARFTRRKSTSPSSSRL